MDKDNHIRLCNNCIGAILSRGEKVFKLESLYFSEEFEEQELVSCELCEEEYTKDALFDCIFP